MAEPDRLTRAALKKLEKEHLAQRVALARRHREEVLRIEREAGRRYYRNLRTIVSEMEHRGLHREEAWGLYRAIREAEAAFEADGVVRRVR